MLDVKEFIESQEKEVTGVTPFKVNILNSCDKILDESPDLDLESRLDKVSFSNSLIALDTNIKMLERYYDVTPNIKTPNHYAGSQDVISFLEDRMLNAEFVCSMIFNIVKYTVRLGRKDDEAKEVEKIRIYFTRMKNFIENGNSLHD
uniref:Nucleotide kinase n=1 Tax=Mammaliicoccus phage MSShimriz1 TaxID=3230127 RepID=A0AAU8GVR7_9VIRU